MKTNERQLLELATEFVSLQQSLLAAWREANPLSYDVEMLLDFPKRCRVRVHSDDWMATRHGLGVRFARVDGLTVDVPFAVDKPLAIEANRLFDFLTSKPLVEPEAIPREREPFCVLFDGLCASGALARQDDPEGRELFVLVV